jgi:hypothetical protein
LYCIVLQDYLPQYGDPARVAAVLEAVRSELAPFLHTLTGELETLSAGG